MQYPPCDMQLLHNTQNNFLEDRVILCNYCTTLCNLARPCKLGCFGPLGIPLVFDFNFTWSTHSGRTLGPLHHYQQCIGWDIIVVLYHTLVP